MFNIFFTYIFGTIFLFLTCFRYVHMLQLESYQLKMYQKWISKNFLTIQNLIIDSICLLGGLISLIVLYIFKNEPLATIICVLSCIGCVVAIIAMYFKNPKKKPLVVTERVKRLLIAVAIVIATILLIASYIFTFYYIVFVILVIGSPYIVMIAAAIMDPVEKKIKSGFQSEAKKILKSRNDLIKIGITGSFGKTSTKFILNEILSVKFNTLCSPKSYNTPMGLTKVIREYLKPEHQVFIAEMGARYVGDIKDLCDFVEPKYGIISSIGKQHLETFKSLENIINTKYDLIRSLPQDGIGYLPDDKDICLKLFNNNDNINKKLFSIYDNKNAFVSAKDIKVSKAGCTFNLCIGKEQIEVSTCLLGKHNIQNIIACCGIAFDLGLSLEEIKTGIANIKPIEHRLELINSPNGVCVIDDAFNANPTGTKMALEVLSYFDGKKIIVTPGLVELGEETQELNKQFGNDIAKVCDVAVLVGKSYTKFIKDGLSEAGFDEGAIVEYETLDEVTNFIGAYAKPGDVVLFENDLPDNYL